ncbi:MAG: glycosyltransferase [Flavobacteriales bacterium]|nr:glycosyltransferase [Flavobacteriales bacterium]MCB9204726.1 glycosyltransferase [Flavobacteriales bacterium]
MSVINDLSTDQRVHKHCTLLTELGYDVMLIGRSTSSSMPLDQRNYRTHRMWLPFEKGPLFYASYNIALFFQLLFRKADLLFSNDLDTLLPYFLVSRLKGKKLIYDSHEFFTEVPELVSRPSVQRIWKRLEGWILPKLEHALTVNQSIAALYKKQYGIEMKVLRNIPKARQLQRAKSTKEDLHLPDGKIIILQGSGINVDRGAEEAVLAMKEVKDATLLILGSGDVINQLKSMVAENNLTEKVIFKGRMPYEEMMAHTRLADLGLTLDKDTNINYRFSLPNKLFDYIHAGIPVLASDLVEVAAIVREHEIGDVVESVEPTILAAKINEMLQSPKVETWKQNCINARLVLNWEKESEMLRNLIAEIDG